MPKSTHGLFPVRSLPSYRHRLPPSLSPAVVASIELTVVGVITLSKMLNSLPTHLAGVHSAALLIVVNAPTTDDH